MILVTAGHPIPTEVKGRAAAAANALTFRLETHMNFTCNNNTSDNSNPPAASPLPSRLPTRSLMEYPVYLGHSDRSHIPIQ